MLKYFQHTPKLLISAIVFCAILEHFVAVSLGTTCYKNEQSNCNEEFIDVYKHLSRSASNRTAADTIFWLFTNKNPDEPESLHKCGGKLPPDTNFNAENELIVIVTPYIVGFCDTVVFREWMLYILDKGPHNVLVVDWSWGVRGDYGTAIKNGKIAAKQTAIVLKNIQERTGITKDKITIIGESLAAQVAGFIGQEIPVGKITALDPPGLGFQKDLPEDERLDTTDADFVEVWHCNAGAFFPYLGINYDAGHVNFWINGGSHQPSCVETILPSIIKRDFLYALGSMWPGGCFHNHCTQYFKLAINPMNCQYVGIKCDSYEDLKAGKCRSCGKHGENCLIMGFDSVKHRKRQPSHNERFYVKTDFKFSYCDNSHINFQGFKKTYDTSLELNNLKKKR